MTENKRHEINSWSIKRERNLQKAYLIFHFQGTPANFAVLTFFILKYVYIICIRILNWSEILQTYFFAFKTRNFPPPPPKMSAPSRGQIHKYDVQWYERI